MSNSVRLADFFCCGGTPVAACDFCGRIHFAVGVNSCIDDELRKNYLEAARINPERYFESQDDSIAFGMWDCRQAVWGCPCEKLKRYEDFFWDNRRVILEYIKARNEQLQKDAAEVSELLKQPNAASQRARSGGEEPFTKGG